MNPQHDRAAAAPTNPVPDAPPDTLGRSAAPPPAAGHPLAPDADGNADAHADAHAGGHEGAHAGAHAEANADAHAGGHEGAHAGAHADGHEGAHVPVGAHAGGHEGAHQPFGVAVAEPRRLRRPLNRPARWLIAAAEVAAAGALAVLTVWAWRRAMIPVELPEFDNPAIPRYVSRMSGPWAAAAVGAATVAGLLVLDAVRHAVLALRAEHSGPNAEAPRDDVEFPH
jgi:hypothetical protein